MPKVSVIVPTYNRSKYVVKAIQSILDQTASGCEIIVVDDGSTDGTQDFLKPYADRIRYLHQKNSGVSAARNRGIQEAAGDWIAFLDSDDEWTPEYLKVQFSVIRRFPDAVGHIANIVSYDPDRGRKLHFAEVGIESWFRSQPVRYYPKPFRRIMAAAYWYLQPALLRRDALLRAGMFDETLTIAEDMDLIGRAALQGPFTFNRQVLVRVYRRHEEITALSSQFNHSRISSRRAFAKVYARFLDTQPLTIREKHAVAENLARTWRSAGNFLMNAGRMSEAREYYRRAFLRYPSAVTSIKYLATFLPHSLGSQFVRTGRGLLPGEDPAAQCMAGAGIGTESEEMKP